MKLKPPDFLIIPYVLIEDGEMNPIDEKLYGVIYWLTKLRNEKCTASNEALAQVVKTSPQVINNSLIKLERNGYILRRFKDAGRRHRSEIVGLIQFARVTPTDVSSKLDTPIDVSVDTPVGVQKKNIVIRKQKKSIDVGFEAFYEIYPKKTAKADAERAWIKLSPSEELQSKILAAVEKAKKSEQWQREGGRYIPYPATYLNGKRPAPWRPAWCHGTWTRQPR
jgi:hypothetical protein